MNQVDSSLLRESGRHLLLSSIEDQRANRADDETEDCDTADGKWKEKTATKMSGGNKVGANSNGQQRKVGPINGVEESPTLDLGKDQGTEELVDEERDCLQHQGALGHCEFEVSAIVTFVCSVDGHAHEKRDDLVQTGGKDCIVVSLGQGLVLDAGRAKGMGCEGDEGDEQNGGDPKAGDGDGLGDAEGNASCHVEEQRQVGSECGRE